MQILLAAGDTAGARGWLWHVDRVDTAGRRAALVHLTRPGDRRDTTLVAIRPAEPLARAAAVDALRPMPPADALEAVRRAARRDRLAFGLTTVDRLRGQVHPWQLAAALAFARGHSRVLLADAVGMGKTVSAAIAVAECLEAAPDRRCLVLVPAHLIAQWRHELRHRTDVDAALADAAGLRRLERALPAGSAGWALPGCLIAPVDFIKQPHVAHALDTRTWDLLVIDEAHTVCGDSERHAACAMLARRARRVLLLTATPSDGTRGRLAALAALGGAGERLVTLRHDPPAARAPMRERRVLIAPHPTLAALHRALAAYTSRITSGAMRGTPAIALLAVLLTRRALSSPHALHLSLARRLALLDTDAAPAQLSLFAPEDDEGVLGAPSGLRADDERTDLQQLIDAAALAARADRRLAALERLVRRAGEPVVIFTCFRDTALLIAARLTRTAGARVVHGRLPAAIVDAAIADFVEGSLRVLVATDVAAQGLNLHARCRWVIHYDLPWRPSTLRQRNGRVDRLGQRKPPRATLLLDRVPAAVDTLERLQAQAVRMRDDEPATPRRWRVLAAADAIRARRMRGEVTHDRLAPSLLPDAGAHVVEISLADAAGAIVERTHVALAGGRDEAIAWATTSARCRARALARRLRARMTRRLARERAVAAAALEAAAPGLLQDGLFDRRGARRRAADSDARARVQREERDARAAHEAAGHLASPRVRVIASFQRARKA